MTFRGNWPKSVEKVTFLVSIIIENVCVILITLQSLGIVHLQTNLKTHERSGLIYHSFDFVKITNLVTLYCQIILLYEFICKTSLK